MNHTAAARPVIWVSNNWRKYRLTLNRDGSLYDMDVELYPRGKRTTLRAVRHPATIKRVLDTTKGLAEAIAQACFEPAAPTNAVLHVPAHKQTRPGAAPAQIVDTEWHALARIAA